MRVSRDSKDLRIRAYRPEDAQPLYDAVCESISEVAPYETWCHEGYTMDEASEYVNWWIKAREQGFAFYYAVEDAATGDFLGSCGLSGYSAEHRHASLGYWIRTSATRRGIATASARLVARAGFEDLGLIRIEVMAPVGNAASLRVAEKLGGLREGTLRSKLILPSGATDVAVFGLFPDAFEPT